MYDGFCVLLDIETALQICFDSFFLFFIIIILRTQHSHRYPKYFKLVIG